MTLLSEADQQQTAVAVQELIRAAGQWAEAFRKSERPSVYGEAMSLESIGMLPIEFQGTPATDLGKHIDAMVHVLPDADIHPEDQLVIHQQRYRVHTMIPQRLFGVNTHWTLQLVRLYEPTPSPP